MQAAHESHQIESGTGTTSDSGNAALTCGGVSVEFKLRSLTGRDERATSGGNDSPQAIAYDLVRRMAVGPLGEPLPLEQLPVALVHRLMAEVYIGLYGSNAECRVRCGECEEHYEFALELRELMAFQDVLYTEHCQPADADGTWLLDDGRRVRAPRPSDLTSMTSATDLGDAVVVDGSYEPDSAAVDEFLERAAPVLVLDLAAPCALCQASQLVRFDLTQHLGSRFSDDRRFLTREIHLLATTYQWPLGDILDLEQTDRRALVTLIDADRSYSAALARS